MLSLKNTCLPTGKKGFTLIELLIVIVIIGFLSTMIMINIGVAISKGRDSRRASDLKQMSTALELYYQDNNSYPPETNPIGCTGDAKLSTGACWGSLIPKKYIPLVPKDPKNASPNIYKYCNFDNTRFVIVATLENVILEAQQLGINSDCKIDGADKKYVFWVGN